MYIDREDLSTRIAALFQVRGAIAVQWFEEYRASIDDAHTVD